MKDLVGMAAVKVAPHHPGFLCGWALASYSWRSQDISYFLKAPRKRGGNPRPQVHHCLLLQPWPCSCLQKLRRASPGPFPATLYFRKWVSALPVQLPVSEQNRNTPLLFHLYDWY